MESAQLGSGTQPHYEAPGNFHVGDLIVIRPKLAFAQPVQIQVMDLASEKILKFYVYITNHDVYDIINQLNKNLKVHFVFNLYNEIRSAIESWLKQTSHTHF